MSESTRIYSWRRHLLAAAAAHRGPELDPSPQLVPLSQELGELLPPALPQRPGKNLILGLLLVLLHGVRQVTMMTSDGHIGIQILRLSLLGDLHKEKRYSQGDEEVHPAVLADAETRPLEIHERHGEQILRNKIKNLVLHVFIILMPPCGSKPHCHQITTILIY